MGKSNLSPEVRFAAFLVVVAALIIFAIIKKWI
jgi:hypothetical protein